MQIKYFRTAWHDIKNSPKWLSRILLLALLMIIPVFGWIVVYGYLYGWARDKAWGIHAPLPEHIFENKDRKLYSRGFFALIIAFVCALVPGLVDTIGSVVTGLGVFGASATWATGPIMVLAGALSALTGVLISIASIGLALFTTLFAWVGTMRMSIYGRLSAGFQIGKIWSMIRHDFNGILRILGMSVILLLAAHVLIFILAFVVLLVIVVVGVVVTGGAALGFAVGSAGGPALTALLVVIPVVAVLLALFVFLLIALSVFSTMMIARALGYWTQQFNVAQWHGQDDPMPFEAQYQPPTA